MTTRIYKVSAPDGSFRLVEAQTKGQALNFVIGEAFKVEPISASELAQHIRAGASVAVAPVREKKAEEEGVQVTAAVPTPPPPPPLPDVRAEPDPEEFAAQD